MNKNQNSYMKRWLYVFVLVLLSVPSMAQTIIHVKGKKGIEAGYGVTPYGGSYNLSYVNHFSKRFYGKGNLFFEQEKFRDVKAQGMGLELAGAYTVFTIGEKVFFNLKGGANVFTKKLNPGITVTDPNTGVEEVKDFSTVKYGVFGGIENEIFLTGRWVLVVGFGQRYYFKGDPFGNSSWLGYAGVRFNL
jgi:hypothetical protein